MRQFGRQSAAVAWALGTALAAGSVLAAAQTPQQQKTKNTKNNDAFVLGSVPPQTKAAPPAVTPAVKRLPDPSPARIGQIIQTFLGHEKEFRDLLAHDYTYTESINLQVLGDATSLGSLETPVPSRDFIGQNYQQVNAIEYNPDGPGGQFVRQIVCTWCPQSTLQDLSVTEQDITDMFNMNMYTVSLDQLPEYNIRYIDHEPLDQITAYVFSVTPKKIVKGQRYFSGKVWVDDHDLMIVKSQGRVVPNEYDKHGNPTNTFLPFTVWRQKIDGKYWFPVYTLMKGRVPGGPGAPAIPMQMVLQFTNYKQFHVTTIITDVKALPQGGTTPGVAKPPVVVKKKKGPGGGGGGN